MLKEEKEDSVAPELAELAATVPENTEAEAEVDGEELDSSEMSAIIYEIPKEPEKWVLGWMGGTRGEEQLQAYSPLRTGTLMPQAPSLQETAEQAVTSDGC